MRISLTTCLLLTLGLTHPVNMLVSAAPAEGSEFSLDGSGSGSGDGSELDESENDVDSTTVDSRMLGWPKKDSEEGYIILANGKSPLSDERVIGAIIGGSVTGAVMSVILLAIVIYVRHTKDIGGCFLGEEVI